MLLLMAAILITLALFVGSILAHELGHAAAVAWLAGRGAVRKISAGSVIVFRRGVFEIGLLPTWGLVEFDPERLGPIDRRLVAAAGPVASAVTALGFLALGRSGWFDPGWTRAILTMGKANIALAWVNLLPIPPLDGWTIIETWLSAWGVRWSAGTLEAVRRYGAAFVFVASVWLVLLIGPYR